MSRVLLIARRELRGYFRSPAGYAVLALTLAIESLLFHVDVIGRAAAIPVDEALALYFRNASLVTVAMSVPITMRLFGEENQSETYFLLYTAAPSRQIALGKFASAWCFLLIAQSATLLLLPILAVHGGLPLGQWISGWLGLVLLGGACVAIGTLGAALAHRGVVAALITSGLLLVLVQSGRISAITAPPIEGILERISLLDRHFAPFAHGVIGFGHITYFIALGFAALAFAASVIDAGRWR